MRSFAFVLLAVLTAVCCSSANATRIYTSGSGDGLVNYYNYDSFTYDPDPTKQVSATDSITLDAYYYISKTPFEMAPGVVVGDKEILYDNRAIIIFPISSLYGHGVIPDGGIQLHYRMQASNNVLYPWYMSNIWYHCTSNLGPSVTTDHWMDGTGFATIDSPPTTPTWLTLDVTDQVRQDISNGFSYSAFKFQTMVYLPDYYGEFYAKGTISSSESGNGPYLEFAPEPSSIIGLICGLSALGYIVRRRKI